MRDKKGLGGALSRWSQSTTILRNELTQLSNVDVSRLYFFRSVISFSDVLQLSVCSIDEIYSQILYHFDVTMNGFCSLISFLACSLLAQYYFYTLVLCVAVFVKFSFFTKKLFERVAKAGAMVQQINPLPGSASIPYKCRFGTSQLFHV